MSVRLSHFLISVIATVLMFGCSDLVELPDIPGIDDFSFAKFDPASGNPADIPLPNDILRNPETGFLALPPTGDPAVDALIAQVNTLRGFSTSAAIRIPFDGMISPETVNADTLLLVDLAALQLDPANAFPEARFRVTVDESGENSLVFCEAVRPLNPGRTYLVILTQGILSNNDPLRLAARLPLESQATTVLIKRTTPLVDEAGNSLLSTLTNEQAQALEPLRAAYQNIWAVAEQITGQDRGNIPLAFAFTTQPLFETLPVLRARAQAAEPIFTPGLFVEGAAGVDLALNLQGFGAIPHDAIGGLYLGDLDTPNYMSDPVNGAFQGEGADLIEVGRNTVPFIAATPLTGTAPYPTVIFQHGITSFKEVGLAIANTLCAQGFAVIGIDLVGHGERTPDVLNNETGAPGPDGVQDASGSSFINLTNLLVSRDNVRQSVSDLYHLTRLITSGQADFNGDGIAELASTDVTYVGHSLGAIIGTVFVTTEPDIATATLNVGGARLIDLLLASPTFGPIIRAGLEPFGIVEGTALFDTFVLFAQTIVDDAESFNYAAHTLNGSLAAPTRVILEEVINDQVVPNSATAELARALGIPQLNAVEVIDGLAQENIPNGGYQGSGLYQFPNGGHSSLLDPGPDALTTFQMQAQVSAFLASGVQGQPTIIDPTLLTPGKLGELLLEATHRMGALGRLIVFTGTINH